MSQYEKTMKANSSTQTEKQTFDRGGGNVFADLCLPDADEHLLKAQIVTEIHKIMRSRKLTQTRAGLQPIYQAATAPPCPGRRKC